MSKHRTKAEREFEVLVDQVYVKWANPNKTRATVERKLLQDINDPARMAIWELAAKSKRWSIEVPDSLRK